MTNATYGLIWRLAVLAAIMALFFFHGPQALIGYLLALLPRDSKKVMPLS